MTTTLSEGVKVPDVGSVNWAGDLEVNWNLLNGALANLSFNVKLDRDNIWIGEQSFTLPIVGSITGTASRAIADEDGTNIKTGYVNVAGNQTVSGQKTWSGNQFFTSPMYPKNLSYEIGNTPASNVAIPIYFTDKNNVYTGYVRNVILTTGKTQSELLARNKFTSGALSPTGTDVTSTLQVEVQPDGTKSLYFDGSIRNNVLPYATNTYSLGSSSYQWSAVYSQTYYYNGTAWGLDKANVWTGTNTFQQNITYERTNFLHQAINPCYFLKDTELEKGSHVPTAHTAYPGLWHDKNGAILGYMRFVEYGTGKQTAEIRVSNLIKNGALDPTGSTVDCTVCLELQPSGEKSLIPEQNNDINLGTSTNKWKSLNGINPGALSLPNLDAAVEIDTTGWVYDGTTHNSVLLNGTTPSVNGWLWVRISNSVASDFMYLRYGNGASAPTVLEGDTRVSLICLFAPIVAGQLTTLTITKTPAYVKFYPSLGNV